MKTFLETIDGKKTYIVAGVVAALTFAKMVGWITGSELESLLGIFGAMGLITLRDAVRKLE